MRFGTGLDAPDPSLGSPFDPVFRRAEAADEAGFDMVVVPHHRFTTGYPVSPWVMLGAIAARTTRVRLGTNVFILPLDHPLDVAEQVATVDQLSDGRVFVGAGLGYRPYEYEALGLRFDRRGAMMGECLEVLQRTLAEEAVSFHGRFFDFSDLTVVPRPVQRPRPPIYVGANSEAGIRRAARLADGYLVPFPDPLPKVVDTLAWYRREAAEAGRSATVVLGRSIGIGSSRRAVEEEWLPDILRVMRGYRRAGAPTERNEAMASKLRSGGGLTTLDDLGDDVFIAGTPDDVVAGLRRAREMTGCDVVLATPSGPDPEEAWRLFTREVMPALAEDSTTGDQGDG